MRFFNGVRLKGSGGVTSGIKVGADRYICRKLGGDIIVSKNNEDIARLYTDAALCTAVGVVYEQNGELKYVSYDNL